MISSGINTYESQANDNDTQVLSNTISSTPSNIVRINPDAINLQAILPPLAAPAGWRSEIIHSDSSITTDIGANLVSTSTTFTNNYEEFNTTNTYKTSQIDQLPPRAINNSNEYLTTSFEGNAINQRQSVLTEQQQQNIIHAVERQQPPPVVVRKTLPNNLVTYRQNVSVKYLQPPPPPPPGPLIIREVRPPPPPPQSPIQIRQRAPPIPTPPPLVLRERPPPVPPRSPAKVIEKLLPSPPQAARRVVVERYGACPPKPSDVVIERWLPYKQTGQRRILVERASVPYVSPQEPNLLVLHDSPQARVRREFINQGVVRADPDSYMQRYGAELNDWHRHSHLVDEASRAVPPPITLSDHHYRHDYDGYCSDRAIVSSPIHRSSSYHYDSSSYDSPQNYCTQSSYRYGYTPRRFYDDYCTQSSPRYEYTPQRSYDDYGTHQGSYLTMTDITPSWNRYCRSSSYDDRPSTDYRSSSTYPHETIRVGSNNEFRRVLCDLTNGHVPSELQSY